MEDSQLPITKWVPAIWFIINHKNGVSSCEVARALGITQKSAWYMCHRIRFAVANGSLEKLSGAVEVDETFVGGKSKNMHKNKRGQMKQGGSGKTVVMGIIERGGEARAMVVDNTKRASLVPEILEHVEEGSNVYTDSLKSYDKLGEHYGHQWVDHKVEYVNGLAHTNNAECFWSLFKRAIKGTYVQIDSKHTNRYLAEQTFRYNHRKANDSVRFETAVGKMFGKRLMYKDLIGA